jgi:ABC-type antimicrobial peptide transport system permease subunit
MRKSRPPFLALAMLPMLAAWQLRRTWRLLTMVGLGIACTIVLVCAVPLFSDIAITAGVRSLFDTTPANATFGVQVLANQPSPQLARQADQQIETMIAKNVSSLITDKPALTVQTPNLLLLSRATPPGPNKAVPVSGQMLLSGYPLTHLADHLTLLKGRLPAAASRDLEIAITQSTADNLRLTIGSLLTARLPSNAGLSTWTLRVAGIFAATSTSDSFWQGNTFQPGLQGQNVVYQALASNEELLTSIAAYHAEPSQPFLLSWTYQLSTENLNASNMASIDQHVQALQQTLPNSLESLSTVQSATPFGVLFESLPQYVNQVAFVTIPIIVLLIMFVGITVLFLGIMTDILIEREQLAVTLFRNRGSSRRQIFAVFLVQGGILAVLALLVGVPATVWLVRLIASWLLPSADQNTLNLFLNDPRYLFTHIVWIAVVVVIGTMGIMSISINRAANIDMLALRSNRSRPARRSLWQRLNIDVVLSILVLLAYIDYVFTAQVVGAEARVLLGPLSLIAPLFMLLACILLFLRFFPLFLHLCAKLAVRSPGITAMLALVQADRAPRSASRMILLLSLSLALATFTLTFVASQQQRASDVASYRVGADFSGQLPYVLSSKPLSDQATPYQHIRGVSVVTLGYQDSTTLNDGEPVQIVAVDSKTFTNTAVWSRSYSKQQLSTLMALLVAHRADAALHSSVYAVVDASLWNELHLTTGASFTLPINGIANKSMHYVAAAEVQNIPGVYDAPPGGTGFLVDYQSYTTAYSQASGGLTLAPNTIWLRTVDNPAQLASIRRALTSGALQLSPLLDRRAIAEELQTNPLQIEVIGILSIGFALVLALGLIGSAVTEWANGVNHLTYFAVLRTLGMTSQQIGRVLLWEQSLVYALSLLLGIGLGALLSSVVVPLLAFSNALAGVDMLSASTVPSVQIVIPDGQLLAMIVCVSIVLIGILLITTRRIVRSSLGQVLRLNES